MLVLTRLFTDSYLYGELTISEASFLILSAHDFTNRESIPFLKNNYITVYDTETKTVEDFVKISDYPKIDEVFGVVKRADNVYFKVITDKLWKFMDICDGIQKVKFDGLPDGIRANLPNDNTIVEINGVYVYVNYDYYRLDENSIFWSVCVKGEEICMTVLDVYLDVFEKLDWNVKGDTVIYFFFMNWFYKLDINDKVIRFITKLRTLGC